VFCAWVDGLRYGLVFDKSPEMTPDEMLGRASLVFIGVIEGHHFDSYPFFRVAGDDQRYWKIRRRRVRVETVLPVHGV